MIRIFYLPHTCRIYLVALLVGSFIQPLSLKGQEQTGMRMERYAGIYSASVNPANISLNPQSWDLNILAGDLFGYNSYGYLQHTKISSALRHYDRILEVGDPKIKENPDALILDYYKGRRRTGGVGQGRMEFLSFSTRFNERHRIGFSTAARFQGSTFRLPPEIAHDPLVSVKFQEPLETGIAKFAAMAWGEFGLHYAFYTETNTDLNIAVGISPKLLTGMQGFYARVNAPFVQTRLSEDTVAFENAKWEYGLTTDLLDYKRNLPVNVNGWSGGLDVGFSFVMPDERYGRAERDYLWRVGFALMDVGAVRFKKNAQKHIIENSNTVVVTTSDLDKFKDPQQFTSNFSEIFLSDPNKSLSGNTYKIGLPTAFSVQFDYKSSNALYLSGLLVQRVPLYRNSLRRVSTLAFVPRLEHRWASFSTPVVLTDWRSFRVGAAARLAFITIGSDDLASWIGKKRLTGSDFYMGIKINSFNVRQDSHRVSEKRTVKTKKRLHKRSKVKCYKF